MLDQMSGGRLDLGVGKGISPHELAFFGLDMESAQARFRESLRLLRTAFGAETLDFEGSFHQFHNVPLAMRPHQQPHPPLWYGVLKPETAEWAAREGMHMVCGNGPAAEVRACVQSYRAVWQQGAAPGAEERLMGLTRQLVIAPTDAAALQVAKRAFAEFRRNFVWLWERNNDPLASYLLPEDFEAVQQHGEALAGSPETVARVLREQLEESGANYLVCRFAFGDLNEAEMLQSMDLFASRVMPSLSGMGAATRSAA
jgi:alkanesulfonate monooxygenase SsuD/methylene tetrahydromethanopterin reductase-like flavin-dependent oxidoreductase (luciferase family)